MVQKVDDGFEQLNSGVADEEPEEARPGVMGHILITLNHMKEKVGHSPRRGSTASTPSTPSAEETRQHESKVEDLKDSPRSIESREENMVREVPQVHFPPDQQHNDGIEASPAATHTASSGFLEAEASPRGSGGPLQEETPSSPTVPHRDLGEKIMSMLPGCNTSPYAVGAPTYPQAANPHPEEDHSAVPTSPHAQRSTPSSPRVGGKLELITKLADKLRLHEKSSSPRAAISSPRTTTTNSSTPAANNAIPTPTAEAPNMTIGTATGPVEH